MKKIIISLIITLFICSTFINIISYASDPNLEVINSFTGTINNDATSNSGESVRKIIGSIFDIVRIIGASVAIAMLMIVACKYIIASAGDKADVKKYAINYIIGALILFGASGILTIIKNFVITSLNT